MVNRRDLQSCTCRFDSGPCLQAYDLRLRALDAFGVNRGVFQYGLLQFGPGHRLGGSVSAGSRGSHS